MGEENKTETIDITQKEVEEFISEIQALNWPEEKKQKFIKFLRSASFALFSLKKKKITITRLREMLFGQKTEKRKWSSKFNKRSGSNKNSNSKKKGHGKNGIKNYTGAKREKIAHGKLKKRDKCPLCGKSRLYEVDNAVTLKISGSSPLAATIFEREKLRCPSCGEVFTADLPEGVDEQRFDASAGGAIATLKYGYGIPLNRLENLQDAAGVPLPSSTAWDEIEKASNSAYSVWKVLNKIAAGGDHIFNDDTTCKIISLMQDEDRKRKGMYTTGILSKIDNREIVLFFSGWKHAGENLNDLLEKREQGKDPPVQMCDAASRNLPATFDTIVANCNAHSRRKFIELEQYWPEECTFVIDSYEKVYKFEALAKKKELSPDERLEFHLKNSKPVMDDLKRWCDDQIDSKKVEPNSDIGDAIKYVQKHWKELTQFLKTPGAALDNNACERLLKKPILLRKNSLFYKTEFGAFVGDILMGTIHTAIRAGVNPIKYLTAIIKNSKKVADSPDKWLPWNYEINSS